jgi:hypothetical protein
LSLQDHGRDLGRAVLFVADLDVGVVVGPGDDLVGALGFQLLTSGVVELRPMSRLMAKYGLVGVGHGLPLGDLAYQPFLFGEGHDGRRGPPSFGIGDALGSLPSMT